MPEMPSAGSEASVNMFAGLGKLERINLLMKMSRAGEAGIFIGSQYRDERRESHLLVASECRSIAHSICLGLEMDLWEDQANCYELLHA